MPDSDRKNAKLGEPTLAMMAEMQRINDELHHLGEETVSRVNALLREEAASRHPHQEDAHHEEEERRDRRRSA